MTLPALATSGLGAIAALAVVLGLAVVIAEPRAEARARAAEAASPPSGQFVTVDGLRVHARVQGDGPWAGPDIVLIHGASGSLRDFTFDLADRLAADWRVIAFDRPGMGFSDTPAHGADNPARQAAILRAAATELGVRRPLVLGHSYGGAVAMAWALDALDRPDAGADPAALVLLAGATHPWPGDLGLWYRLTASPLGQRAVIPLVAAFAPETRAKPVVDGIFAPQPAPDGYAAYMNLGLALRLGQLRVNALQVNGLKPHVEAMAPRYPDLSLPIEILHGTEDTIVGLPIHSARMAQEVASAALTPLPGLGHMPHHADPEATLAAIDRAARRAGLR